MELGQLDGWPLRQRSHMDVQIACTEKQTQKLKKHPNRASKNELMGRVRQMGERQVLWMVRCGTLADRMGQRDG